MPGPEQNFRHQKAIVWHRTGTDRYGQPTVDTNPTEINVRWNATRSEALDPQGNTVALDATVIANVDIAVGAEMWLGELADWTGTGSGSSQTDEEVMTVKTVSKTADVKGRMFQRTLGLMRKHNHG